MGTSIGGNSIIDVLTPETLDQNAYVYASEANVRNGRARGAIGPDYAVYAFPERVPRRHEGDHLLDRLDADLPVRRPMKVSIVVISKNEPALLETLDSFVPLLDGLLDEVVVVDASGGTLDFVRDQHDWVKWVPFTPRPDAGVTIPEQRNLGVAEAIGDVVVFTDCGCVPEPGWLPQLLAPILDGDEQVTCGRTGIARAQRVRGDAGRSGVRRAGECARARR